MAKNRNRRTQTIPENETAAARFIRVVTPRVNKAVKAIDVIGFCTGSSYEHTPAQVKQIHDNLAAALERLGKRFLGKADSGGGFEFK